jgi:hypothetical protein
VSQNEPPFKSHDELLQLVAEERPEILDRLRFPEVSDYFYSRVTNTTWVWGGDCWENNAYWQGPVA